MKNILKISAVLFTASVLTTGCIKETLPQTNYVTVDQAANAPGSFDNFVTACTSTLVGTFQFGSDNTYPFDYGYPTFYFMRDVMGQDIVLEDTSSEWYSTWYQVGTALGPEYLLCQVPWTYYYSWINNCNTVIQMAGEEPDEDKLSGAGIAYAMRAMFYMDLARMFQYTYVGNEEALTVPIVTENTTDLSHNPRVANRTIWEFILSDLDKAEEYLADYNRTDVYTPDVSVVYGLKARAYLVMENFVEAEKYAKLAQAGYSPLSEEEYCDRLTGFNTPNHSWMFGTAFNAEDPNILLNDSDSNWGSMMFLEVKGGLYASAYGAPKRIDAHLYETIPDTDFRKKCFSDPSLDEMDDEERTAALAAYTDYPQYIDQAVDATTSMSYAYLQFKFRAGGGAAGRENPYAATVVSVPIMRVEEMMLIEAEAAGMQDESRGRTLLEAFAKTRDASYSYENSGISSDNSTTSFRDKVWWQRRVELWGEGFATFDIKRLNKGITRSYKGTNHPTGYRYNTESVPAWMNLCIVNTEINYNYAIEENNPTPVAPGGDSSEFSW